ncbi:type 2A phosphatase-associated protein 42 [Xylariomycetidae sp. FL2044]|nr:type 2A phosphatase-associated protein 42 [Xylariomycetidae sp. FL2044]
MSDEPRSLKSIFQAAERTRLGLLANHETNTPTFRDDLARALNLYQECLHIIQKVSLFSDNEAVDDIATSDLPYLLVSFYIAELLQKISAPSPQERKSALNATREAYEEFLHLLDNYSLLSAADSKLFTIYNEDPGAFSTISTKDPTARRNAKIANFKAEKGLKTKLEYMRNSPRYLEDGGDEEAVRELYLANAAFCTHMTFQALEGISREMEMLALAPVSPTSPTATAQEDGRRRLQERGNDGYSERLDMPGEPRLTSKGPLLSKEGKPLRPFTLTSNRQELQKGVFRPGHNLPTMSIDEYLEEERRQGNIIEGGGEASGMQPEPDEDDVEKADLETMKAREWDEFKEANPRGSGNTLNRG